MTRRALRAASPRPTGRRAAASDRVLGALYRVSRVLDRLSGTAPRTVVPRASVDRPGPSGDDIGMQPDLPEVLR